MTTTSRSDLEAFSHVMIDIETMSLHPHKALVLSIGMIEFDPEPIEGLVIRKQEKLVLEIAPQLLRGRRVDIGTQKFWEAQDALASEHWVDASEHHEPGDAVRCVREFCLNKPRIWAKGPQFDLSNIIGLGEDFNVNHLWHYQAPRDMRTFCRETPANRLMPVVDGLIPGVAHDPIYDCISQAWQVWAHWGSL